MQVAVIIPFFQRQPGVLRRALRSVTAQEGAPELLVIVVDDSSPVPGESEVPDVAPGLPISIRVLRQENQGPSAARNRGLAEVPAGVEFVAFLDSDDEWSPSHVRNAVQALQQGFDFYFANHYQLGQKVGAFERAGRLRMDRHRLLAPGGATYAYQDDMFDQILTGNVIGTSTVVLRRAPFQALRFREDFVYAGDDYLFWMDCSRVSNRFVFSTNLECTYGAGVNLYSGSGWGTETHLERIVHETAYMLAARRLFDLTAAQRRVVEDRLAGLRQAFARDLLHRVRHGGTWKGRLISRQFRQDPKSALLLLPNIARVATGAANTG